MAGPLGFALSSLTGLPPTRLVALAQRAERRGFGTLALTESYNDVMPLAAAVAGQTRAVTIATAIANVGFRHPALMGMGAASVDELSGGRFVLGLGVGTQWFDRAAVEEIRRRPLGALAEYVRLLRRLWEGGTGEVEEAGELYRLDRFHLDFAPPRPRIPIYLAALGPGMLRLAGRIADGVFLTMMPLEAIPGAVEEVRETARAAGRQSTAVTIAGLVRVCLDDDQERARDGVRASIPLYLTFPGYARFLTGLGYGAVVEAGRAAYARGDVAAAAAAVPDELVDRVGVYGGAERCRERLERFRAAGLDLPIVSVRRSEGEWETALARAIDALGPSAG